MINSFTIFKNKEVKDDKSPTHTISCKIGEEYKYIGRCWTKDGANGKFLSCQFDKPYNDKPGYTIEVDMPEPKRDISKMEAEDVPREDEMPDIF